MVNYPKLVIASDGRHTGVLLDGVFIGQGIERLDFSSERRDGEIRSTIRILDLDVACVKMQTAEDFNKLMKAVAEEDSAVPAATGTAKKIKE